jgi:heat shock protein HslJ
MSKLVIFLATAAAVLALLAAGCSAAKAAENPQVPASVPALQGQNLANTSWVLVSYGDPANPTAALPQAQVTLSFNSDTTQISGDGGVNGYGGDCVRTDNQIALSGILHTMMASTDQAVNEQENTYFSLLGGAQSVAFGAGTLTINCAGGQVLVFNVDLSPSNLTIAPPPSITSAPMITSTYNGVTSTTVPAPVTTAVPPTIIVNHPTTAPLTTTAVPPTITLTATATPPTPANSASTMAPFIPAT